MAAICNQENSNFPIQSKASASLGTRAAEEQGWMFYQLKRLNKVSDQFLSEPWWHWETILATLPLRFFISLLA